MLIEKITLEEQQFMECWFTPECLASSLFSNFDHLVEFEDKLGDIRNYQLPMLGMENAIDLENPKLTRQENFNLRKGAGDVYNMAARAIGKSLISQKIAIPLSLLYDDNFQVAFSSADQIHLEDILNVVARVITTHPIISMWKRQVKRSPKFLFEGKNGWILHGINANIAAKDSGTNWFGIHANLIFLEEVSLENQAAYEKRKDAVSEMGAVLRCTGMVCFPRHSPAGDMFHAPENKNKIINLSQHVNPTFTKEKQKQREQEYAGVATPAYRMFVEGEAVEDGKSVIDLERIRPFIDDNKQIKSFEIKKDSFPYFRSLIVVKRPTNSERIWINGDIGDGRAGSAITIFSEVQDKFYYIYRIELYNLADDEQYEIFDWLIEKLSANVVGIDRGDGSIDANEFVLYKEDNQIKYCRAKELDKYLETNKEIYVPTYNNDKLEWKPGKVSKHYYKGTMIRFYVNPSSGSVGVTPNHSMMVYTSEGLKQKQADEVVVGDWVLTPKIKSKAKRCILELEEKKLNGFSVTKKRKLKLTEDLAYFLGWATAEGSSKTTGYQLSVGDSQADAQKLLDLSRKLFKVNSGYVQVIDRASETPRKFKKSFIQNFKICYNVVLGGGSGVLHFCENLVGSGAKNKRVPLEILNSNKKIQRAFLRGLLEGDGNTRTRKSSTKQFAIKVISDELIYGVSYILKNLDIWPTFRFFDEGYNRAYVISWTDNQFTGKWKGIPYSIIPLKNGKSRIYKKVYQLKDLKRHRISDIKIDRIKQLLNSDFLFRRISQIDNYDYDGYVYDLMVEDNNTFCAGNENIVVHNTGRAIFRRLEKKYNQNNLVGYAGVEKIAVDFKKNDNGEVLIENGKPVMIEERMAEWSVRYLISMLYNGQIIMPRDYKLERQLSYVTARAQGNNTCYSCLDPSGDHCFDSLRVFATAVWLRANANLTPKMSKEICLGVNNWTKRKTTTIASYLDAIKDRREIECNEEEYKNTIYSYLINESMQSLVSGEKDYSSYLDKEIKRLNALFNK